MLRNFCCCNTCITIILIDISHCIDCHIGINHFFFLIFHSTNFFYLVFNICLKICYFSKIIRTASLGHQKSLTACFSNQFSIKQTKSLQNMFYIFQVFCNILFFFCFMQSVFYFFNFFCFSLL